VSGWLEALAKIIPGEKVYDDALAPLAKQVGAIGGDVGKTARLILAPLQALAHSQDRLDGLFRRMAQRVPEERRIEVVPEISVPAIQALEYLDDKSELWKILEEILTKAADRESVDLVHPAFVHIARQLAPDEITLLLAAPTAKITAVDRLDFDRAENKFINRKLLSLDLGGLELQSPNQIELLVIHLEKLGLLEWPVIKQVPVLGPGAVQTGITRYSEVTVTDFGKLFIAAATPPTRDAA
jgi:hypothetical protein